MRPLLNNSASPIPAICGASRRFAYVRSKIENPKSKIENPRPAFTLIELLVVLVIVVTLVALAVAGLQRSPADRINASARQLQSRILLARSIAARDQRVSGIRLVQSTTDPWVADSVELISSPGFDSGTLNITNVGGKWLLSGAFHRLAPHELTLRLPAVGTWSLNPNGRNLIRPGSRIEIPEGSGKWYTIGIPEDLNLNGVLDPGEDFNSSGDLNYIPNVLVLDGHYTPSVWDSGTSAYIAQPNTGIRYRLELAPTVTAGEEPLRLQPGTAIDLAGCKNLKSLEILFAPGQGLTGDSAANGNIYLYLTTLEDVELTRNKVPMHRGDGPFNISDLGLPPIVPANPPFVPKTEPLGIAVFAQTGNVLSFAVDQTDTDSNDLADQWFSYGRSGKEVGR